MAGILGHLQPSNLLNLRRIAIMEHKTAVNKIELSATLLNFADKDSASFIKQLRDDSWNTKHKLLNNSCDISELPYCKLQNGICDALSSGNTTYSASIAPSEVDYKLFERFSKQYDIDFDVQTSKLGSHVNQVSDVTSVGYCNMINTLIKDGSMIKQVFTHVTDNVDNTDKKILTLFDSHCQSNLVSANTVLKNNSYLRLHRKR